MADTHEGNDPMGAPTTHRGPLANCPAPECQDRIIEQQGDAGSVCICEHTEQQHFEDACLACDCRDYLPPAAAREVIARYQEAAKHTPVDRAAVLLEVADRLKRKADTLTEAAHDVAKFVVDARIAEAELLDREAAELRRLAAEAQQPETEEPAPLTPCTCRQAVHALEHHGRTIPNCPWCTPAPNIRPNQPAGRTVNTVDTRLLGTKEAK